ncbi:YdcF family protein [Desulfobulbus elongatus]|uniref:YdcF family protein n=1 Tax=Desulfobulbus elongatus TaxID=53332 RepID=UPI00146FBC74|nr:ElyC/SanA/YdcF family protein [Desulfobulbus elongatus]
MEISETPVTAEVVVQFTGPDDRIRRDAAVGLLARGLAPLLMVPAQYSLLAMGQQGIEQMQSHDLKGECWPHPRRMARSWSLMENTHKELMLAKCAMDRLQLHSAILVSSPYHMRRIRLIADRVFDKERYRIVCVAAATDQEGQPGGSDRSDWWWLIQEYPKILWFLLYEPFVREQNAHI